MKFNETNEAKSWKEPRQRFIRVQPIFLTIPVSSESRTSGDFTHDLRLKNDIQTFNTLQVIFRGFLKVNFSRFS